MLLIMQLDKGIINVFKIFFVTNLEIQVYVVTIARLGCNSKKQKVKEFVTKTPATALES